MPWGGRDPHHPVGHRYRQYRRMPGEFLEHGRTPSGARTIGRSEGGRYRVVVRANWFVLSDVARKGDVPHELGY